MNFNVKLKKKKILFLSIVLDLQSIISATYYAYKEVGSFRDLSNTTAM